MYDRGDYNSSFALRAVELKNKIEKNLSFFFNFQKIGSDGSVKRKIKKLWPK